MERLLHYVWQHRLYPYGSLRTSDGTLVEVIDPGLYNNDAGPDFIGTKLSMSGEIWIGNVEVHMRSSDWYHHGHDKDEVYNNVILHVVSAIDREVLTASGRCVPQVAIQVPDYVEKHYNELLREERNPPCYQYAATLPLPDVRQWLDRLAAGRLGEKAARIHRRVEVEGGDWERVFFITLARSFGFGINGEAFEQWATNIPLMAIGKHRDDPFQIEALFLGMAGLLEDECLPSAHRESVETEGYYRKLQSEFRFLAHKFTLHAMDGSQWRFLRLRPQNFPHIRLVQLSKLYVSRKVSLSIIKDAQTIEALRALFHTDVTPYWKTHYTFGAESKRNEKSLREASIDSIIINAVIPMLYAYGAHSLHDEYGQRALAFLQQMKAEKNRVTRQWADAGIAAQTAADSQALIELRTRYCDRKDCLRCNFGRAYLHNTKVYHVLQEQES